MVFWNYTGDGNSGSIDDRVGEKPVAGNSADVIQDWMKNTDSFIQDMVNLTERAYSFFEKLEQEGDIGILFTDATKIDSARLFDLLSEAYTEVYKWIEKTKYTAEEAEQLPQFANYFRILGPVRFKTEAELVRTEWPDMKLSDNASEIKRIFKKYMEYHKRYKRSGFLKDDILEDNPAYSEFIQLYQEIDDLSKEAIKIAEGFKNIMRNIEKNEALKDALITQLDPFILRQTIHNVVYAAMMDDSIVKWDSRWFLLDKYLREDFNEKYGVESFLRKYRREGKI